jgi:two-component system chemotaxis response regulator CheB
MCVPGHDIVTIGASAGGVELLLALAPLLPGDLPASIFVVVHTSPTQASLLPELLSARGPIPAVHPVHGETIVHGRIYVAPPDNQMLIRPGFIDVVRGPRENGQRPAVDPLFRSAARSYGARVIGVILSGHLDCGTAGMMSVKARGGLSVVQAPGSAIAPEMPENVLQNVAVDHVVQPAELAQLLVRLVEQPARRNGTSSGEIEALEALEGEKLGAPVTEVVCPLCQGVLTETRAGEFQHFRCHVGHAFSFESLVQEQTEEMERALWAAVRSLDEGAALSTRLARTATGLELRKRFVEKGENQRRQADVIRRLLLDGGAAMRLRQEVRQEADLEP